MDLWWNQIGVVFKHVLASTNDMGLQHETVDKWRMDITLKENLKQLHHNLLRNVNKNFMTKPLQHLPRWWKIVLSQ
jgi:hypothetical protein